jgi:hypothetical protein
VSGLLAGLATNLTLSQAAPSVSWLWWNPAGWLATITIGSLLAARPWRLPRWGATRGESLLLGVGFLAMLALLAVLAVSAVL